MLLTEEYVHANVPRSSVERKKFIAAQEKSWLSLGWDRSRYSQELADTATRLLSAIAFSDLADPIDLSLLATTDDAGSSIDAPSSDRGSKGSKRPRDSPLAASKPSKKAKRSSPSSSTIPPKTQVACLDRSSGHQWVLGRISRYVPELKKYEVLDDADGEEQIYRVFKKNIRVIPKKAQSFDTKKKVLAVYPQTTVFYPARLISRKGKNWVVEFDDEDEADENKFKEIDGRLIIIE